MKILLVDDHRLIREALRYLLEQEAFVVMEANDGREALAIINREEFDVILMDICMPELNGIDATRRLLASNPGLKIIGLSMHTDSRNVQAMFDAGAVGYVPKNAGTQLLLEALRTVMTGQRFISPELKGIMSEREGPSSEGPRSARRSPSGRPTLRPLTVREREVLQLLAEGKSSKEIASSLDIAMPTVETHRRQIAEKLGVRTIAELTKYAIREGITTID
ncbi:MAG: response regulator [Myxococcota bacterium]